MLAIGQFHFLHSSASRAQGCLGSPSGSQRLPPDWFLVPLPLWGSGLLTKVSFLCSFLRALLHCLSQQHCLNLLSSTMSNFCVDSLRELHFVFQKSSLLKSGNNLSAL